ncbi:MAG: hypothetical protein KIT22_08140 [Verrucomicrobiae bacterium]|nr:hypothetical protein [Verrucomicrobiae bacterium]
MNSPTRTAVLSYLAATFAVGAVAGGAIGYGVGRRAMFRPPDREEMRVKVCERFTSELHLDAEQQRRLDPLIRQGMDEFDAAHREHEERLRELMRKGHNRLSTTLNLTPEQKAKFEAMEAERERRMSSKPKGPPGGPPRPSH